MSIHNLPPPADTRQGQAGRQCFAHHHMKLAEFGLWTHAREVSHETQIFYFDGRKVAARFHAVGKSSVYALLKQLVKRGWLETIREPRRLKNGMFAPGEYRPLSHDEWVSKHGSFACCTSPETGTGPESRTGANQSQYSERPVRKQGHKSKGLNRNKTLQQLPLLRDESPHPPKAETPRSTGSVGELARSHRLAGEQLRQLVWGNAGQAELATAATELATAAELLFATAGRGGALTRKVERGFARRLFKTYPGLLNCCPALQRVYGAGGVAC